MLIHIPSPCLIRGEEINVGFAVDVDLSPDLEILSTDLQGCVALGVRLEIGSVEDEAWADFWRVPSNRKRVEAIVERMAMGLTPTY